MYYEQQFRRQMWQGFWACVGLVFLIAFILTIPVKPDAPAWVKQYWQIKLSYSGAFALFGLVYFPIQIRRHRDTRRNV